MFFRWVYKFVVLCLFILLVLACAPNNTEDKPVYTRISDGTLKAGSDIPAPTQDVMVAITGKIGTSNVDDSIEMDRATIESIGLVDYTVDDPFDKKTITYRGVLMSDLLDVWQVDKAATSLRIVALNDYSIDVPISDLRKYPVIFAIQADGEDMPIETRGPAMLVYPYNDFEFDTAIYNDYWIWQIKSIEVS